jgi:hypothetical protein
MKWLLLSSAAKKEKTEAGVNLNGKRDWLKNHKILPLKLVCLWRKGHGMGRIEVNCRIKNGRLWGCP